MENLLIYLAGQIHDDWRNNCEIRQRNGAWLCVKGPQENHDRSDNIGELIKGKQPNPIYRDQVTSGGK